MKTQFFNLLRPLWERIKPLLMRYRRKRYFMPVSVFVFFVFCFVVLVVSKPQTKPVEDRQQVWSVSAQRAQLGTSEPRVNAFGELVPRRKVNLRALVAGEVVATSPVFEEGARAEKGEELLRLDPFNYENALADAEAQLRGGRALLIERKAALDLAKVETERAKTLREKGTVAQKYADDRNLDLAIAESRYQQQLASVDRLKVLVKKAKRDLENTVVRAPFDGHLSDLNAREGRLLGLNDQLATISDATSFEVRFNLSDVQYGRILESGAELIGRPVDVMWRIGGEEIKLLARLTQVGAQISQNTRGVDLFAQVEGDIPPSLRGGAFVTVVLRGAPVEQVIEIKRDALYGDNRVYVIMNGRLQSRTIEIIGETDETVFVRSGLADGEQVLLTQFNEAAPEVAVKVVR